MTVPRQPGQSKPRPVNDSDYAARSAAAATAAIALLRRVLPGFKLRPPDAGSWRRFVMAEFLLISAGRRAARIASVGHYQWVIDATAAAVRDAGLAARMPPSVPDVGWVNPAGGPSVGPLFYDINATQALLDRVVRLHLDTSGVAELTTLGTGGIEYHVAQGARESNLQLVDADSAPIGWVRILGPNPNHCAFCITLASRGPVYKTERAAQAQGRGRDDHKSHDHCQCQIIPVFDRNFWPNKAHSTDWALNVYNTGSTYRGPDETPSRNPSIQNLRRWLDHNPQQATRPAQPAVA